MKDLKALVSDFKNLNTGIKKLDAALPRMFGKISVDIVQENFKLQGYDSGTGVIKWPKRHWKSNLKYDEHDFYRGTVYSSKSPLLLQSWKLYYGIQYWAQRGRVKIGVDSSLIPYAKTMNEGGIEMWLGKETTIPARQFLPKESEGANPKIETALKRKYDSELKATMKGFEK